MLRLYFAPLTRAIRIKWLLEELGLPHEIVPRQFNRTPGTRQDTPSGRYPVLYDGETMLSESGAVVQYILEKYGNGRLQPAIASPERAAYLYWFHFAEASAAAPINQYVGIAVYSGEAEKHAEAVEYARQGVDRVLGTVEAAIAGRSFLAGDALSGADIMMGFTLWSAAMLKLLDARHPETLRYLRELKARPAFAKALAEGRS
ncbi:MAG TPA: glutathione S-transferase family protein [Rhizomicrobium sp.]|jgi:glutathione S-transferase|nr:glutathione S-transferase family protein [Rhizomicrobium sp.]